MTRVAMGGTFDVLHRGHHALLDTAFEHGDEGVAIGLTTDEFANARRMRTVRPYVERAEALHAFLRARGYSERATIIPIADPFGFALEPQYDAIAVTTETATTVDLINGERTARGLPPLAVFVAPYVLADDGEPIKATRIRLGEIDADGRAAP
jgi:pantetheine-phosphate adenylyltransferase